MHIENLLNGISLKLNLPADSVAKINSENEFLAALIGMIVKEAMNGNFDEEIYNALTPLITAQNITIPSYSDTVFDIKTSEFKNESVACNIEERVDDKNKEINIPIHLLFQVISSNYQKDTKNNVNVNNQPNENAVTTENLSKSLMKIDDKSDNYSEGKNINIALAKQTVSNESVAKTIINLNTTEYEKNIEEKKPLKQFSLEHTDDFEFVCKEINEFKRNETPIEHVKNTVFDKMTFHQNDAINTEVSDKALFILTKKTTDDGNFDVDKSKDYIEALANQHLNSSISNEMNKESKLNIKDTFENVPLTKTFEISKFNDKIYIKKETHDSLSMFIENKEIGKVKICLSINDGVVKAEVFPNTEQAKTYFKENIDKIFSALNSEGINLGQFALKDSRDERKFSKNNKEEVQGIKALTKQDSQRLPIRKNVNIKDGLSIYA